LANLISVDYLSSTFPLVDFSVYTTATLSGFVTTASKRVESFLNFNPTLQSVEGEVSTALVDSDYNLVVYPKVRPVQSVSSLKIFKGSETINLTLDNGGATKYNIVQKGTAVVYPDREISVNGAFFVDTFATLRNTRFFVEIDYIGGYATIPGDMQYACALFVLDTVSKNQNALGAESVRQGDISISYGSASGSGQGKSDNVADAESILMDYKKVTP